MSKQYNPNAEYVVCKGRRISLPPTADNPFKRFISGQDVDDNGQPVRFTMSHRTAREVQFLVEVKGVIQLAPVTAKTKEAAQPETAGG